MLNCSATTVWVLLSSFFSYCLINKSRGDRDNNHTVTAPGCSKLEVFGYEEDNFSLTLKAVSCTCCSKIAYCFILDPT